MTRLVGFIIEILLLHDCICISCVLCIIIMEGTLSARVRVVYDVCASCIFNLLLSLGGGAKIHNKVF